MFSKFNFDLGHILQFWRKNSNTLFKIKVRRFSLYFLFFLLKQKCRWCNVYFWPEKSNTLEMNVFHNLVKWDCLSDFQTLCKCKCISFKEIVRSHLSDKFVHLNGISFLVHMSILLLFVLTPNSMQNKMETGQNEHENLVDVHAFSAQKKHCCCTSSSQLE